MPHLSLPGRLTADAEHKSGDNWNLVSFTVASSSWESGEKHSQFWKVCCWGNRWKNLASFLKKGANVTCFGSVNKPKTFEYNGETRIDLSINCNDINLHSPGNIGNNQNGNNQNGNNQNPTENSVPQERNDSIIEQIRF